MLYGEEYDDYLKRIGEDEPILDTFCIVCDEYFHESQTIKILHEQHICKDCSEKLIEDESLLEFHFEEDAQATFEIIKTTLKNQ